MSLLPSCAMAAFFGLTVLYSPGFFIPAARILRTPPGEGMALGLGALQFAALLHPILLRRSARGWNFSMLNTVIHVVADTTSTQKINKQNNEIRTTELSQCTLLSIELCCCQCDPSLIFYKTNCINSSPKSVSNRNSMPRISSRLKAK